MGLGGSYGFGLCFGLLAETKPARGKFWKTQASLDSASRDIAHVKPPLSFWIAEIHSFPEVRT